MDSSILGYLNTSSQKTPIPLQKHYNFFIWENSTNWKDCADWADFAGPSLSCFTCLKYISGFCFVCLACWHRSNIQPKLALILKMFFMVVPSARGPELVNRPTEATAWKHQRDVTMSPSDAYQNCFQTLDPWRKPKRRWGHLKFTTCHDVMICHHFWEANQLAGADLVGWFGLRKTRWTEAALHSDCALWLYVTLNFSFSELMQGLGQEENEAERNMSPIFLIVQHWCRCRNSCNTSLVAGCPDLLPCQMACKWAALASNLWSTFCQVASFPWDKRKVSRNSLPFRGLRWKMSTLEGADEDSSVGQWVVVERAQSRSTFLLCFFLCRCFCNLLPETVHQKQKLETS